MFEYLNILKENWAKFSPYTRGQEKAIIEQLLELIKANNRKIKEAASDVLEAFVEHISSREGMAQPHLIDYFVSKVKTIISKEEDPVEVMVCIRCFGHLASLIKRCLGQEELQKHFLLLFEISQNRVLDDITDSYKADLVDSVQPENFKKILYRQKQLNSHIKAFALIVKEMETLSEPHAKHLLDLFLIGVKKHRLFFEGYKKYLYIALAQLICSLAVHTELYKFWVKKAVGEMLNVFVETSSQERDVYDQDYNTIKTAAEFISRLLKQEVWADDIKQDFMRATLSGMLDFFNGSDFGYDEITEQGKKLYIPHNNEDHHSTLRLALIFEEIQRQEVLDPSIQEHYSDFLALVSKGIARYPRTTSLQKLFRSLLAVGERLSDQLLLNQPDTVEVIAGVLEAQFGLLRELRGDILFDNLRSLIGIPSIMLKTSPKLLEVFRRALLITLESSGPQSLFMLDHAVTSLERVLVKEKVEMREGKDKFLQEVLPYFAALIDFELGSVADVSFSLTVQEASLHKEQVQRRCIGFLGSLGSDLLFIARGRPKENELEQAEADSLKISLPISKHKISLNLNHVIKRCSQLALESPVEDVQAAASELFHGSIIVLIGKCSQGAQAGEDFVEALESSLPTIVRLAISSTKFAPLFRELLMQISRWLSLNKEEESPLVSSFIGGVLSLAGSGDKPEMRSLCLQCLEQFLSSTYKFHIRFEAQIKNFDLFFRKVEALTLHPDPFKRLGGLISLKLVGAQICLNEALLRHFFFEVVYYFLLFLRKQEQTGDALAEDCHLFCDAIYSQIEGVLRGRGHQLDSTENEGARFSSLNDLFLALQKNLFSPEFSLRDYSLRLFLLIRTHLKEHLLTSTLKGSLAFLDEQTGTEWDDPLLSIRSFSAKCATLAVLIETGTLPERELRESRAFVNVLDEAQKIGDFQVEEHSQLKQEAISRVLQLAGVLGRSEDREKLIGMVRSPGLVKSVLQAAFSGTSPTKDVEKCKKVLSVLNVALIGAVRDFVNSHEYRFDGARDPIYSLEKKISPKSLEQFFTVLLLFLSPEEVKRELLNSVRVYHMLRFVKSARKNSPPEAVARAKILLSFLLNTGGFEQGQIIEFLDPFGQSFDNFAPLVQNHLGKLPESESRPFVRLLFLQSRKNHNLFSSILDLLALFVSNKKSTVPFFESFNESFDPGFIRSHDLYLKNILNLGIIFLQQGNRLAEEQCAALVEQALLRQNRASLGTLALEFLGHFAKNSSREQTLLMYRRTKLSLLDYSQEVLPVIFEDSQPKSRENETTVTFASRMFDFIKSSLMLEPFEVVFPLIRNRKRFRTEISSIIDSLSSEHRYDYLLQNVQFCFNIFKEKELSPSLEFNIRFTIIDRVLLPLLESTTEEHLRELFIELFPELEKILMFDQETETDIRRQILSLGEKGCVFRIFELFFRKISPTAIKDFIHPRIVGIQSQKNELTKKLIIFCTGAKKTKREKLETVIRSEMTGETELTKDFACEIVFNYFCAAYSCLVSVLLNTQTKEGPFTKFLLTSELDKDERLLQNLVESKNQYDFKVYTNFLTENVNDYYKTEQGQGGYEGSQAKVGVRQFVARLTADSLFTQTITRGRLVPEGLEDHISQRQQLINLLNSQDPIDAEHNRRMDLEKLSGEDSKLEMDKVNQHPIMRSVIRLVDHLAANFKAEGTAYVPSWITLFQRLFVDHTDLNSRILLLKVVLNRQDIFKPFREYFTQYLLEYLGLSQTGGAGFHYFLRDVCTTLLLWFDETNSNSTLSIKSGVTLLKKLCFDGVKNLCKKLADESKPIFLLNIDIFQKICHLMKNVLVVEGGLIFNLLRFVEKSAPAAPSQGSEGAPVTNTTELSNVAVLWRLAGISVLETCIYEGIEIGTLDIANPRAVGGVSTGSGGSSDQSLTQMVYSSQQQSSLGHLNSGLSQIPSSISMDIESESKIIILHEKLLMAVLDNMKAKKKVLSSASFRLAGIYLSYLWNRLPYSSVTFEKVKQAVIKEVSGLVGREGRNLEVNLCELCKVCPEASSEEPVLVQLTSYIMKTSGKQRGYVFNSLRTIYKTCLEKPTLLDRVSSEMTLTLQSSLDKILRDSDPNNIREFVLLLTEMVKLKDNVTTNFLEHCLNRICEIVLKLMKPEDSVLFFDFIVLLHENYKSVPGIVSTCKRYMIVGLSHPDESVRKLFIDFLQGDPRVMGSEEGVLTFILKDLYNPEFEQYWLTTSAQLVLSLSSHSTQSSEFVFDRPLAGYVSSGLLTFPSRANLASQMSQPLIPLSLVAPSQEGRVERPQLPGTQGYELKESVIKVKSKYFGVEAGVVSDDKINHSIFEEAGSGVFNPSEIAESTTKLSVLALSKTLAGQSLKAQAGKSSEFKKDFGRFLHQNQVSFNQVSQTDDNKVRVVDVIGAVKRPVMKTPLNRKEQFSSASNILKTLREYRQGELPDIQIKYSDLIKPLTVLASQDPKMAQLIFVPLFIEVHQKQNALANQSNFKALLQIIDQSQSNYQVINTVQTILYELSLHAQSLEIDPSLIAKTGTGSLSFGGAALLLEDMLTKVQRSLATEAAVNQAADKPTTRVKANFSSQQNGGPPIEDDEKFVCKVGDNQDSIHLILNLIEIYKQMNEEDILRGLYRLLHDGDSNANGVFDLKMGKKTTLSLKKLEEMITESVEQDNTVFRTYLSQEKRENLFVLNRWEDLVGDISIDPDYTNCFRPKEDGTSLLTDIVGLRKNDRYFLLRAMLNKDSYWETIRESTELLMAQFQQKALLEKEHPYELSLLAITMSEFDRARFYLEKFKDKFLKNWSGVKDFSSLQTKTEVVSELLRQHELKDFLYSTKHYNVEGMVGSPDLERFFETLNGWLKRRSSATLDNFNYLSDSYHSRCLFIDIMKNKYEGYTEELYNKHHVKASLEYTRGLLRLGYVDTAERVLGKSFQRKERYLAKDPSLDYDFASLIIKSKIEGVDRDINFISRLMDESNIDLKFLDSRFSKIDKVMDYWMAKKESSIDPFESLRFSLLKLKTKAKEISCIRDYIGPGDNTAEAEQQYFRLVSESVPIVEDKMRTLYERQSISAALDLGQEDFRGLQGKMLRRGCDITESLLRWFKTKAEKSDISLRKIAQEESMIDVVHYAKLQIKFTADLVNLGYMDHSRVLFVLEITAEFSDLLANHFQTCFEKAPVWIFIKWIPQLMSYLNLHSGACFLWVVELLLTTYPEPMIYALSVSTDPCSNFSPGHNLQSLKAMWDRFVGKDNTQVRFIRAVECLLHPDQRLKLWLDNIEENANKPDRLIQSKKLLLADLFSTTDDLIGEGIGDFNKKFAKEMEKHVTRLFGNNFKDLENMRPVEIIKGTQELYSKADAFCRAKSATMATSSYKTKLSAFSGWLSEYDINNYRRHDLRIEVPGQYSGDREPVPELHVKVSYFMPEILVIQSIRKPKRLTMLATDEKIYHCLVKGGEDLRLDQRIEQLFSLMNEVFNRDTDCSKREFSIGTFNVIPVKKNLGVMEWVKNTIPLKLVIEKELSTNEDLLNNNAYYKRSGLLKQLAKGKDVRDQHLALLAANRDLIVSDFNTQQKYFKSNLLKLAIKKKVQNAEQFVKLRKSFIVNYAVLSLGSYILGVGDRHLDNFLFDYVNGRIIPIDFGYSFGLGVGLYIPELMPFRLTQNFVELTYPLGVEGLFRNSMIFAMKALKDHRSLLLDTCEVFIRDPLLDWVKLARAKSTSKNSQALEVDSAGYPRDNLRVVQQKLAGYNPVTVMLQELDKSRHKGQIYTTQLTQTVRGAPHRFRASLGDGVVPLCDQVDALIDMSRDPDILGRAWSGWAPYV